MKGFLNRNDVAAAVYFAALHDHGGDREAWIDVILGTFGSGDSTDHVTFGCRVGPVPGQDEPAAWLVLGAIPYGDSPIWGEKLARDEALRHPWLSQFWEVVDFVLVQDPDVNRHIYA